MSNITRRWPAALGAALFGLAATAITAASAEEIIVGAATAQTGYLAPYDQPSLAGLRMAGGLWWVHRLRASPPCGDAQRWEVCVDRLAYRFGIRRRIAVRLTADGDSPLSVGWWKPMVLLPAAIAARMPEPLLEALIAHELAHIRRHDYLVNLLQGVVEALLFYHPVVWWLSHRIRIQRICRKAIDRFGGNDDQFAGLQSLSGFGNVVSGRKKRSH